LSTLPPRLLTIATGALGYGAAANNMTSRIFALFACLAACGPNGRGGPDGKGSGSDSHSGGDGQQGCGGLLNCYSVYAHADHELYVIDLMAKTLTDIGPFHAPNVTIGSTTEEDVITDLAVAPDNTIYVISETALYTASPTDGHVTSVGTLAACGERGVALTTTPDGKLWEGDFTGVMCNIDISGATPVVGAPITIGSNMALSGDFVAIADGTVYGTAYDLADGSGMGTQANNVLVKLDLTTGAVTKVGSTGYGRLFGTSYADGKVFAFTHDATGDVVTLDPTTGVGTLFQSFNDPTSHNPISFAGAGVNSLVPVIP